jgi:hypothetical protein
MGYLADAVLDNGLQYLADHGARVDLCSQEPATYTEATSTYSLGNKTGVTVGSPEARSPSGRKVVVPQIAGGSVTGTGTATHWALSKTSATAALLAAAALASAQAVTSGNSWGTTAAWDIGIPGP